MASEAQTDTVRGKVFGEVAEMYDAARPGYADAMVAEVLGYAALGDRAAVEVGAGTGKATLLFAAHGVPLVCVEPDPRMAEVLRRNTAACPEVRIEVCGFEEWEPGRRRFGLLFAATSWHWMAPDRRWGLAHAALEPGGALALFWNPLGVLDAELHAELAEIDHRHGVITSPHGELASAYGDAPGSCGLREGWPEAECRRDGRFTDLRSVRFRQALRYDTDRYLAHLASVSAYRVLPEDRRDLALADTGRLLDARGGGIDMHHMSDLFLARAR
ncbi:class I SAM-dependent methyltransferase [Streptomyces sp. N2-109]|uniref:Class I SAM-dependent methyltransferase n=1 Tax=Streptomyces gossypii TaxID=2883101 RepID=A0ABT2JNK4_9ACTN|nr:class I SAM-dependent methyltransferase [Streptomyces gossypii]MCT2589099.1 class I SAM-dependent methyltransferase [Streptomyces gossypii]